MPTPNLFSVEDSYTVKSRNASDDSNELKLLYVTDRRNESIDKSASDYRQSRSNTMAFGEVSVSLKPALDWQELSDVSDGLRGTPVKYSIFSCR